MDSATYMRADARQLSDVKPDLSQLLGLWVNTNPETNYISRIDISERNGSLLIRAYGAGSPDPVDWGEIAATPYVGGGTDVAGGITARYDFGTVETFLAANQKLGILVIQSYTSFKDDSGRLSHFSREFFHR